MARGLFRCGDALFTDESLNWYVKACTYVGTLTKKLSTESKYVLYVASENAIVSLKTENDLSRTQ
jgi:hypothetical protein